MAYNNQVMQELRRKVTAINLAATGPTSLIVVPAISCIEDVRLRITSASGASAATIRIGRSAASYTDWMPATILTGLTSTGQTVSLARFVPSIIEGIFVAGSEIFLDVTIASAGTLACNAYVRGHVL